MDLVIRPLDMAWRTKIRNSVSAYLARAESASDKFVEVAGLTGSSPTLRGAIGLPYRACAPLNHGTPIEVLDSANPHRCASIALMGGRSLSDDERVAFVREHVVYELEWMIDSAARFVEVAGLTGSSPTLRGAIGLPYRACAPLNHGTPIEVLDSANPHRCASIALMGGRSLSDDERVAFVREHVVYELEWMIDSAARFVDCHPSVAYLDSAAVHARNLLDWTLDRGPWGLQSAAFGGGDPGDARPLLEWCNKRVLHIGTRQIKAPWPGEDYDDPRKMLWFAGRVLHHLRVAAGSMPVGAPRTALFDVVDAADVYLREPTEELHQALHDRGDFSAHEPYPVAPQPGN